MDSEGSPTLLNCLMYKLSYYIFGSSLTTVLLQKLISNVPSDPKIRIFQLDDGDGKSVHGCGNRLHEKVHSVPVLMQKTAICDLFRNVYTLREQEASFCITLLVGKF